MTARTTRVLVVVLALLLWLAPGAPCQEQAAEELRAMGRAPLGDRTPVVFVHGHGMEFMAAPLYASWAKFLQGRGQEAGESWWQHHKPYLFTYDTAVPDQDYRKIGDALAAALVAEPELFDADGYRARTPVVGVTFSAGAVVWHQAMRWMPEEARGDVFSVSPPTQGTVGATFIGPYALDRGGPEATARFRAEYRRRFEAAMAEDFLTVYPAAYRARVRRALGAADDRAAAVALASRHWESLVEAYEEMASGAAPTVFRTLAVDNLGPGGGPLIDPERLVAMGAVDEVGEPFVNTWLRELHEVADYSRAHVYMGRGNTDLRRSGLAGLLAGGGPGGAGKAERQRQVAQDATRSEALPEGLADADPTVPRALGAGEFLPEGNRPKVVYVTRMSHHQGVFHPGVLLHIHDSMTRITAGYRAAAGLDEQAAADLTAGAQEVERPAAEPSAAAGRGGVFGMGSDAD